MSGSNRLLVLLIVACCFAPGPRSSSAADPDPEVVSHIEWLAGSLREMQTIKPGMTREEALNVFQEEGGLSTRTTQRYAYRECPYIKVDVIFEAVGAPEDKLTKSPKD